MGGLLARVYVARHRPAQLGRVVMLGTPNGGSEVADLLQGLALYRKFYGPAGQQLTTHLDGVLRSLPALDYAVGIIAGNSSIDPISSILIVPRPNDGRVSVESSRLDGMADHVTVKASHNGLLRHRARHRPNHCLPEGRPLQVALNGASSHGPGLTAAHRRLRFKKRESSMENIAAQRAAEKLLAAHQANLQFKALAPPEGPATIADAYDIQERYVTLLRREHGGDAGYKVGLTSAAMQAFCGIDHPIGGVVLAKRVHASGATVRRSDFGRLGLEFEIAVRIASDVPVTDVPYTADTIGVHIGGVGAAIELVDDRSADYANLDVLSLVADNSWNGGIVLSEFATTWRDLESVLGRAAKDGARDRRRARARHPRTSL